MARGDAGHGEPDVRPLAELKAEQARIEALEATGESGPEAGPPGNALLSNLTLEAPQQCVRVPARRQPVA